MAGPSRQGSAPLASPSSEASPQERKDRGQAIKNPAHKGRIFYWEVGLLCLLLAFLAAWNTYLEPLVFTSSLNNFTLPLSLNNFNDVYGQPQWNLQMAATTVSILPIMLVYLFFQEKVTDAMVNSGLKG